MTTGPAGTASGGWEAAAGALPIGEAIGPLRAALADRGRAVLHAPPGAGKTTVVPLALLGEPWRRGTVVVLEPRRLAVRAAARRMAELRGEALGEGVGWRMRHDTKVSRRTEVEVVTEGTLTRRIQRDPELTGVAAVVFDEFHERSLDADLGLALTLEVAEALRPDLRLVVMSATLDVDGVAELLDAPVVRSEGRTHPVDVVHVDTDRRARPEPLLATTIAGALRAHQGDLLVFLPGVAEIERTAAALGTLGPDVDVRPLHGRLSTSDQDLAIRPAPPGRRKVVLSTSIAETSLTIEGVTVVVDGGWRRGPRLDAASGMTRLATSRVTRAEATQRAGRSGRLGPGTAIRMWSRAEDATLRDHPEPEIEVTDLSGLALEVAAWGADPAELAWLTPPPTGHLAAARDLLRSLHALDDDGLVTPHGRAMAELPVHPRLAHLAIRGGELGHGSLAADTAAVLHESGWPRGTDLVSRVTALRSGRAGPRGAAERSRRDARRLRRAVGADEPVADGPVRDDVVGLLVALGFPDRIGRRRPGARGEFVLSGGRGAFVDETHPLAGSDHVVAVELDGRATRARIHLGIAVGEDDVRRVAADRIEVDEEVEWDSRRHDVVARRIERFGAITLAEAPLTDAPAAAYVDALLDGIAREGASILGWSRSDLDLRARLEFLHRLDPSRWAAVDDDSLVRDAGERIRPYLHGARRRRDLDAVDVRDVLLHGTDWSQRGRIDELAPERLEVPSGNRHRVDYTQDPPVLAVKLQEMFGATETPTVGGGRVPVVLHLLSPAGRPVQVTQDLPSFWAGAYRDVRADLRGRYPKHPWPEDPTTAAPTARTKRR